MSSIIRLFRKKLFLDHQEKYVFLVAFDTALDWFPEVPEQAWKMSCYPRSQKPTNLNQHKNPHLGTPQANCRWSNHLVVFPFALCSLIIILNSVGLLKILIHTYFIIKLQSHFQKKKKSVPFFLNAVQFKGRENGVRNCQSVYWRNAFCR